MKFLLRISSINVTKFAGNLLICSLIDFLIYWSVDLLIYGLRKYWLNDRWPYENTIIMGNHYDVNVMCCNFKARPLNSNLEKSKHISTLTISGQLFFFILKELKALIVAKLLLILNNNYENHRNNDASKWFISNNNYGLLIICKSKHFTIEESTYQFCVLTKS